MAHQTNNPLINELKKSLKNVKISVEPDTLSTYGLDWTRYYKPKPLAVAFPRSIEEVRQLVDFANQHKTGLVPSGGRTGLSGGSVAMNGEIVVSFDLMDKILDFNPLDQTVRVEAGVVTEGLINFANEKHLLFPIDF
ncbi:MAG: FAD-binding oxidoreductase, partial [bacterium]|nr:FAD-binding oxidoreductase [bacterium]